MLGALGEEKSELELVLVGPTVWEDEIGVKATMTAGPGRLHKEGNQEF